MMDHGDAVPTQAPATVTDYQFLWTLLEESLWTWYEAGLRLDPGGGDIRCLESSTHVSIISILEH